MTKDDDGQGEKWHKQEFVEENKDHGGGSQKRRCLSR
jgi:hypothetical protein